MTATKCTKKRAARAELLFCLLNLLLFCRSRFRLRRKSLLKRGKGSGERARENEKWEQNLTISPISNFISIFFLFCFVAIFHSPVHLVRSLLPVPRVPFTLRNYDGDGYGNFT